MNAKKYQKLVEEVTPKENQSLKIIRNLRMQKVIYLSYI